MLNLMLMLIEAAIMAVGVLPNITKKTEPVKNEILNLSNNFFPRELVISINKGQLLTNVKEPYFINPPSINKWLQKSEIGQGNLVNLITIDTKANIEKYEKYQTVILLTKNSVIYPDRQSALKTYRVTQYPNNMNVYIDYARYKNFYIKTLPIINSLPRIVFFAAIAFIILIPWISTVFLTINNLFYLLWTTCLFWVVFKLKKKTVTYYQLFRLGMHGITIIILLGWFIRLLKVDLGIGIFLSFIIWMVFVFKNINFQSSSE